MGIKVSPTTPCVTAADEPTQIPAQATTGHESQNEILLCFALFVTWYISSFLLTFK